MNKSFIILILFGLLCGCNQKVAESGNQWPNKSIKVIVPFKSGGSTDNLVRGVMQKAIRDNKLLKKSLVVINVEGHYSVGCNKVRFAKPDGYTFLAMHKAMMGGQATKINDFGHKDFDLVAETSSFSQVLAVHEDAPWQTLDELLEDAKARPNKINFGCNIGALNHMAGVGIEGGKEGAKFNFIQIGGGSANFEKINGKFIDLSVFSAGEYLNFRSNKNEKGLRALAYTGKVRHEKIPEVPTLVEELKQDITFEIGTWWFAPKGTPKEAIDGFVKALGAAMKTGFAKTQFDSRALNPTFVTGDALAAKLEREYEQVKVICSSIKVSKSFDALGPMAVPKMVFYGTMILLVMSIGQIVLERKAKNLKPLDESAEETVKTKPQVKMALAMLAITVAYILVMSYGLVNFSISTIAFLFLTIGVLGRFEKRTMVFGIVIALIMGLGCDYIFTEIFQIDLPTGGQ
jgi:putative tricarboxylic transport membrane protein